MSVLFRKLPSSIAAIKLPNSARENRRCWPLPPRSLGFTLAALRMLSKVDGLKLPAASLAWLPNSDFVHPSGFATGQRFHLMSSAASAVLSESIAATSAAPAGSIVLHHQPAISNQGLLGTEVGRSGRPVLKGETW